MQKGQSTRFYIFNVVRLASLVLYKANAVDHNKASVRDGAGHARTTTRNSRFYTKAGRNPGKTSAFASRGCRRGKRDILCDDILCKRDKVTYRQLTAHGRPRDHTYQYNSCGD
jgi:hypothetical protein